MKNASQSTKRALSLVMAIAMILTMMPLSVFAADGDSTLYLKPNSNWLDAGARFAVTYWNDTSSGWADMTDADGDGYYEGSVPAEYSNIIFVRMNPGTTENSWDNSWNQTNDLTVPTDGTNCYTVADGAWSNGDGSWSTYTPPEPEKTTTTVYFQNNWLWSEVCVYAWDASQTPVSAAWPGDAMQKVDNDGSYDIYSAEIPENAAGIIISGIKNGTTDTRDQTPDITDFTDGSGYCMIWADGNAVQDYVYTPSTDDGGDDPVVPAATYVVAGSVSAVFGTEWDPFNTANTMTLNAEGLYEITYESVPVCTLQFKVTDGTWTNSWGKDGGSGNFEYEVTAISDVTITFNADTKAITVTAEATGEVAEPTDPVTDVTIHYRNTGVWSDVYYHAWIENVNGDEGLTGTWPGIAMTENADHANWYSVTLSDLNAPNGIGILFNNKGNGSQTSDIMITANGEYWYDGELLTEFPDTWADGTVAMVDYNVTLHFADAKNWGSAKLYTWTATGATPTGSWPGSSAGLDTNGFYSMQFTYQAPEGQGLSFIFSGAGQTVDLALAANAFSGDAENGYTAEKWIVPTIQDGEGKYYADIVDDPDAIAISPKVDGTTVTFQYKGATTDTVALFGTMNSWAEAYQMTCNEYGVFSVTLEEVPYGVGRYKFVVNDKWTIDPLNTWTVDGDSAFLISDPEQDTNTIKINVSYTRTDGIYANEEEDWDWNISAWGADGLDPQYDFVVGEDGTARTTITLENGRGSQYVCFKVRKRIGTNDWAEQSGEIRVDLSKIVSGDINVEIANDFSVKQSLTNNVVYANKVTSVELDYDENIITIQTAQSVNDPETAFAIYKDGVKADIIGSITASGSTYTLTLTDTLDLVTLYHYSVRFSEQVKFADHDYAIGINTVYASDKFAEEYTYNGELGVAIAQDRLSFNFRLWAPTAEEVVLNLYVTGSEEEDQEVTTLLDGVQYEMQRGENGVWSYKMNAKMAPPEGHVMYYTYDVKVDGVTQYDVVDPYARSTGVNGKRGAVFALDDTDPEGWEEDTNPNPIDSYTDAVIYELHVRDFSIDPSSGISEENRGKYTAFTEWDTFVDADEDGYGDGVYHSGISYLQELGVTHLHLLPVYDYGSVDETKCENFNWGYDPVNYNTPEGSYSTNPYDATVRVNEFKQMVMALHEAGISVIMDVVYNHVYDAGKFCMNRIVPNYFSRVNADGSFSNGSGCGNDTASEREMVRKYIVESVKYWHEEYHIDGFRFDLVGLLDATTINQLVDEVHACHPDVIFYGEGWTLGTAVEPGNGMATQANSAETPNFAYFSDTIRNALAGSNGSSLGFVSGAGNASDIIDSIKAKPWWTSNPTQIVQYASCHDNYTLIDKLVISTGKDAIDEEIIKMNNLAAAIYMTSQGIPFIHAGEEFLREKLDPSSHTGRCENSYNASDEVNHIEWSKLDASVGSMEYSDNVDYYKALIAFRKAHPALRLSTRADVDAHVTLYKVDGDTIVYIVNGEDVEGETAEKIVMIFNAGTDSYSYVLDGTYSRYLHGTDIAQQTVTGSVTVAPRSAMILTSGAEEKNQVTNSRAILGNTLNMEFAIPASDLAEHLGVYARVERTYADGRDAYSYVDYMEYWDYESGYYILPFTDIAAKEMGDSISITLYDITGNAIGDTYTRTMADYLYSLLALDVAGDKLKTLVVDMLNYGAAAQVQFDYGTEDLVNSNLTDAQKALGTQTLDPITDNRVKGTKYLGTRLVLEDRILMQMAFSGLTGDMCAEICYTDYRGQEQSMGCSLTEVDGTWIVEFMDLVAAEGRCDVTVTIYNADDTVYSTGTIDSMESYAARSTTGGDIYEAIMKYSDSARAYLLEANPTN